MLVKTPKGKIEVELYKDDAGLNEDPLFYRIIAFSKDKKEMSHVNFSIQSQKKVWLYHVATKPNYQHMGLATALIQVMEYFITTKYGSDYVEGKYAPSNDYAKYFYEKNHYDIWEDSYKHYISKSLYKKEIIQVVEPLIEGEIVIKNYQEYKKELEAQKIVQAVANNYPSIFDKKQEPADLNSNESANAKELKI